MATFERMLIPERAQLVQIIFGEYAEFLRMLAQKYAKFVRMPIQDGAKFVRLRANDHPSDFVRMLIPAYQSSYNALEGVRKV